MARENSGEVVVGAVGRDLCLIVPDFPALPFYSRARWEMVATRKSVFREMQK